MNFMIHVVEKLITEIGVDVLILESNGFDIDNFFASVWLFR